ncbi:MAG: universal stress protein [Actinomycetota bacterium]|nr:universal stress protein [Actinomycetota bacterium]
MTTIVTGFIDNPEGQRALELAIEEATRRQARLIVVHSMRGGSKTKDKEYFRYQTALEDVASDLEERGIAFEIHEYVRDQTPAEDLVAAVEEFDAELLVIGYRRRTATGKAMLGSHAQDVLMDSTVPVLAVMAPG